jgi:hypothetical protein
VGTKRIKVKVDADASLQAVWDVLADSARYAEWGVWDRSAIEKPGPSSPQGLGAIRALTQGRRTLREEIVTFEPPTRFSYRVLSGIPVRDYLADVELSDNGRGGTTIVWTSAFSAAPVVDVLIHRKLTGVIHEVATRLAARAAAGSSSPIHGSSST